MMTPKLVEARAVGGYRVWLRFSNGAEGEIDLADELWGEVFESLRDPVKFRELRVHPELATLVWPTGADFAPEFLYEKLRTDPAPAKDEHKAHAR